ncbi:MAG: phosphate regulon transcriptional regulator PhoB [Candidatus Puniceispirillaceae bacterium]
MENTTVLIIEDSSEIQTLLEYNFRNAGYNVAIACDGDEGLNLAEEIHPDVIILDWMMPLMSGIEVLKTLRKREATTETPIIMLTAKAEEHDRLTGLDKGADDYVVKPFSPAELIARTGALLRRTSGMRQKRLKCGDLEMELLTKKVKRAGQEIKLGPKEFMLLEHLLRNQERVYSRQQLLDQVWGHDVYIEDRTVDVHIRRLRKAINVTNTGDLIRTVRSMGYALEAPTGKKIG